MSDPPLPRNPGRLLQRAGNLLTSNGQVVKELVEIDNQQEHNDAVGGPSALRKTRNGLGAAIKQKFQDFKDRSRILARSKSLSDSAPDYVPPPVVDGRRRGHSRSVSDVTTTTSRPPLIQHPHSAPPTRNKRHSAQAHLPTLKSVSEDVPVHHGSLPVVEDDVEGELSSPAFGNVRVPQLLQQGTPMTKVSMKKHKKLIFRLDADMGQIVWASTKIIPIENIKEIRSGEDARYYREQFQLSQDYQDRWLTIIYILDGTWKTLHLIPATRDVFRMWDTTLRELHSIRQQLMRGLGNVEMRQALWEKHYWKGADEEQDQKLTFEEVEKLCRRLNINSSREDLERLFMQADTRQRNYLDFTDFRRFVKLLKGRPEIDRLYKKLRAASGGVFDFPVFEKFMREKQESNLSQADLQTLFDKYSSPQSPTTAAPDHDPSSPSIMTTETFTQFLLSPDNSVFADQHKDIWHDMTRPLPEYFISSSHNTYLVGHQLVGDSTIEGYIRALLHSCRSVELDIYDGEQEPMIFHGKTLTSKVSLRVVCAAIAKYGFVASPYPIIISAEVHCSVPQQDMLVQIMEDEFGDILIKMPPEGLPQKIEELPSPEELKRKILFKTKNLLLNRVDTQDSEGGYLSEASSSTSDSEVFFEKMQDAPVSPTSTVQVKRRQSDVVKDRLSKARTHLVQRVRSVGNRGPSATAEQVLSQSPPSAFPLDSSTAPLPSLAYPPHSTTLISPSSARRTSDAVNDGQRPKPEIPFTPTPLPLESTASPLPTLASPPPSTALISPSSARRTSDAVNDGQQRPKPKMSMAVVALLVYTVGVKCRGINKKEEYAPEHMFSLSENTANKMLRFNMWDLIKHTRNHMVRTYPKGARINSTNYQPHRFWAAGMQLVSINWQTFDLGYMINHAMFQRNGRSGYVLKPPAIRYAQKDMLNKRTMHAFVVSVISAQQLPRPRDASGREVVDKGIIDPFVEVTLYIPDWPVHPDIAKTDLNDSKALGRSMSKHRAKSRERGSGGVHAPPMSATPTASTTSIPGQALSSRTSVVKKNGFNPVWEEKLTIPFECVGDMFDLIFVRFVVRQEDKDAVEPLAVYCASLGSLQHGYRHLPLHDSQLSQYLFSTLFVRLDVVDLSHDP